MIAPSDMSVLTHEVYLPYHPLHQERYFPRIALHNRNEGGKNWL